VSIRAKIRAANGGRRADQRGLGWSPTLHSAELVSRPATARARGRDPDRIGTPRACPCQTNIRLAAI